MVNSIPLRGQVAAMAFFTASDTEGSSGAVFGENRAAGCPSRPIRNFSKFQEVQVPDGFARERSSREVELVAQ